MALRTINFTMDKSGSRLSRVFAKNVSRRPVLADLLADPAVPEFGISITVGQRGLAIRPTIC